MSTGKTFAPLSSATVSIAADELDLRSDRDIIAQLQSYQPVRQERNLWTFWDRGFSEMAPWLQRNVCGWVRRMGKRWDVRCLDMVPGSPNHILNFVAAQDLPDCIVQGTMQGPMTGPHASDMARLALLYHHGGAWLDIASLILCNFDEAFWGMITDDASPVEFFACHLRFRVIDGFCLTGLMSCRKGNPFVKRWMTVFFEVWKGRNSADGLHAHPLFQHLDTLGPLGLRDVGFGSVENIEKSSFMDYFTLNWAYERVRLLQDPSDGWNGIQYFHDHVYMLDAIDEMWLTQTLVPTDRQAGLLALPYRPDDGADADQALVKKWLEEITARSLVARFSSSYWRPGLDLPVPLPKVWQDPAHLDDDIAPGTWAEYLRFASEHYTQTRFLKSQPQRVDFQKGEWGSVFSAGLFEPIV